ncbi:MAG TPA: methyltransferase domain-containing protein [Campylobacterales bacterium]|nr:methyltransferase domain-containing protein [Campylobacterales bacterium]
MVSKYVQYGCGFSAPESWENFDASPTLYFERIPVVGRFYTKNRIRFPVNVQFGNIVNGLPFENNSIRGIYCSHILEHLSLEDFRSALKNTYKILELDGIFRLVLPDLEYEINKYIADSSADASVKFLKNVSLGQEKRVGGIVGFLRMFFGNSLHLWMWDYKSIKYELELAGFKDNKTSYFW